MLANNVTQNQAFCIATACLQVPVSNPLDSSLAKAYDQTALGLNDLTNKLQLLRPSLPEHRLVRRSPSSGHLFASEMPVWFVNLSSNSSLVKRSRAVLEPIVQPSSEASSVPSVGISTESSSVVASTEPTTLIPIVVQESQLIEYPDFNRIYAQIQRNASRSQQKQTGWRPTGGLLQLLDAKRTSWANLWQSIRLGTMRARSRRPAVSRGADVPHYLSGRTAHVTLTANL